MKADTTDVMLYAAPPQNGDSAGDLSCYTLRPSATAALDNVNAASLVTNSVSLPHDQTEYKSTQSDATSTIPKSKPSTGGFLSSLLGKVNYCFTAVSENFTVAYVGGCKNHNTIQSAIRNCR